MSDDDLLKNLQKLFESNQNRWNAPIKESYDEFDNEPRELDDQDGGDQDDGELPPDATAGSGDDDNDEEQSSNVKEPKPEKGEELPPEAHADVFSQPSVKDGIIFINPDAIPNDYPAGPKKKGHFVSVYKVDKSVNQVRINELKLGVVPVPFSIIKKDESGREYVTKEDIAKAFSRGNYVFSLLKLQPKSLDRKLEKPEKKRKQWEEPSPSATADVTAQPGTSEYYSQVNATRVKNGLPPIPQSQWKLKK